MTASELEWAKEQVDNESIVMHVESSVIGKAVQVYAPKEWISPVNGKPVSQVVLRLDNGHAFLVPPIGDVETTFQVLSREQAAFYRVMVRIIHTMITESAALMNALRVNMDTGVALLVALLKTQTMMLQKPKKDPRKADEEVL